jgi:hypothetical protein
MLVPWTRKAWATNVIRKKQKRTADGEVVDQLPDRAPDLRTGAFLGRGRG